MNTEVIHSKTPHSLGKRLNFDPIIQSQRDREANKGIFSRRKVLETLQQQVAPELEVFAEAEITPKSAGFLSRVIDVASNLVPKEKAAALLTTAALLVSGCGGSNGNETTTTPPTTTESTTTTLPQPTTTTKAPTTTPTTVPETTTTTDPLAVCKASGDIYDGNEKLKELGEVKILENHSENLMDYYIMLAKPVSLNTRIVDYQETQQEIYTLSVCLGQYEDGTPYIREYMLDIAGEDNGFYIDKNWTRNFNATTNEDPLTFLDDETRVLINQMIVEGREIGLYIPKVVPNNFTNCNSVACTYYKELKEKIPYNDNTYNDLLNKAPAGIVRIPHEGEPEIGSVQSITLFPLLGGW